MRGLFFHVFLSIFALAGCADKETKPRLLPVGPLQQNPGLPQMPTLSIRLVTELSNNDQVSSHIEMSLLDQSIGGGLTIQDVLGDRFVVRLGETDLLMSLTGDEYQADKSIPDSTSEFVSWMDARVQLLSFENSNSSLSSDEARTPRALTNFSNPESYADRIYDRCAQPVPQFRWQGISSGQVNLNFVREDAADKKVSYNSLVDSGAWPGTSSQAMAQYRDQFFSSLFSSEERQANFLERDAALKIIRTMPSQRIAVRASRAFSLDIRAEVEENKNLTLIYEKECAP